MSEFKNVQELKQVKPSMTEPFSSIFIMRRKMLKKTKFGNPFLIIELGDAGGNFTANVFDESPVFSSLDKMDEGAILSITGKTKYHKDRFSPILETAKEIKVAEAEASGIFDHLVETPPESEGVLWKHIEEAIIAIEHPQLKETVQHVMDEISSQFRISTAAISMHHAYRHGLLEHTAHMVCAARALLPLYPQVDADLAIAGIVLHDIGKIEEYKGDFSAKVSRCGTLQGHVVLGFRTARRAAIKCKLNADLTERLEHIILSHQGEKEWGAAAMAATPEAVFVSMIDNLDAKMGMVQRAMRNSPKSDEFSDYIQGLQTRLLLTKPDKN